jgi:nucleoside-diphosphate kinase
VWTAVRVARLAPVLLRIGGTASNGIEWSDGGVLPCGSGRGVTAVSAACFDTVLDFLNATGARLLFDFGGARATGSAAWNTSSADALMAHVAARGAGALIGGCQIGNEDPGLAPGAQLGAENGGAGPVAAASANGVAACAAAVGALTVLPSGGALAASAGSSPASKRGGERKTGARRSARQRTLSPAKGSAKLAWAALNPKGQSTATCSRSTAVGFAPKPRRATVARSPAARAPPARPEGAVSAPLCATRLPRSSHRATSCGQGGVEIRLEAAPPHHDGEPGQPVTFCPIKEHCKRHGSLPLLGDAVFEEAGLRIVAQKRIHMSPAQAESFYGVHRERPFFKDLVSFMISGPVVVQVLEGENAVARNRELMGATNPANAAPGTIRKPFAENIEANSVHGSDSAENAAIEIAYFFAGSEIVG